MNDILDKKIYQVAANWHWSKCYEDQDKWEEVLDALQEVREAQKGETLDVMNWLVKVDNLIMKARCKRGEFIRCGNMLFPVTPPYEEWKKYIKVATI